MKNKRNRATGIVSLLVAVSLLTGCGQTESKDNVTEESGVVEIPIIFTVDPTSGKKNNEELANAFNEAYKGKYHLNVEWVLETEEEYRQNLKRMNVTDTLPAIIYDVCTVPSFYQMMVEEQRLTDLTPYLDADPEWKNSIEPAVLQGCTYEDGNVYLGPISTAAFTCSGIFYNERLFDRAGIEKFPETWEEFWECCDRLQAQGIIPLGLHTEGTGWAPMLIATASVAENEEGAEFMRQTLPDSYNNESGRKLAESLQRMFQYTTADAMHADYDVAFSNFFAGHVAMLPTGYWLIDQIPEGWEDRIRFATFPENTMVASPKTFGWAIVSTYSDEVKEAAVEFLKFRTYYNKEEKETLFSQDFSQSPKVLPDYLHAFSTAKQIVPNYQTKWNSILQEQTLGEALPMLTEDKITTEDFIQLLDESVKEYQSEQ